MLILKFIAGPLIGALIGYFTNYIAVKMLFKPHNPIMIGSFRLPFTPGIIPKRRDALAKALGTAVGDVLLTKKDLAKALPDKTIKEAITDGLYDRITAAKESDISIKNTMMQYVEEPQYLETRQRIEWILIDKLVDGMQQMDMKGLIVGEGARAIKEKVQGSMLAMMLNDQVIQSVAEPVGEHIEQYLQENGREIIVPVVKREMDRMERSTVGALAQSIPMNKEQVGKVVDTFYSTCVEDSMEQILEQMNIAEIVEEKVKAMDMVMLEDLILSVMKKELNAIVNLGALIGLIIGCLNLLINLL